MLEDTKDKFCCFLLIGNNLAVRYFFWQNSEKSGKSISHSQTFLLHYGCEIYVKNKNGIVRCVVKGSDMCDVNQSFPFFFGFQPTFADKFRGAHYEILP